MGLLGTTSAIGTALGPSLGGLLVEGLGWRAIFLVTAPLGVVAMLLAHRHLPADRPTPGTQPIAFDGAGTLVLGATLTAYALAMTLGHGHLGLLELALLGAAVLGAGLFVIIERRAIAPLVDLAMFRDPVRGASLAANLLVSTVVMATLVVGPFYLSGALGLDAGRIGVVLSMGPVVAALTGVPAGRLVDRLGSPRMITIGLVATAAGAGLLSLTPSAFGIPGYVGPIVVITAGYAIFAAANNTAVMRDVGARERGVVSGTLNLSRNLGLITGASVMGMVFALGSGGGDPTAATPAAVASGMHVAFALAAAGAVGALVLVTVARGRAARTVGGRTVTRTRTARRWLPWTLALLMVPGIAAARPATTPPAAGGLVLRSDDGRNSLRLVGLFQFQHAHRWVDGAPDTDALFVNRARVGLVGSVLARDLRYTLVAELAPPSPRLVFANLDYTFVPGVSLRVGQFKRPFSRSFLTPSSELAFIDRPSSVGPSAFGDNADVGVMLHDGAAGRFEYAIGVFGGAGPNTIPDRDHPLVAARVGYHTAGAKPYTESDLDGGPPRFAIAAAALVDLDGDRDHASFTSAVVDVALQARGVSLISAVYAGTRQAGRRWSAQRADAIGHHTQLGYVIAERVEPVVRYALMQPREGNAQHDLAGGLNVFLRGHAVKWQTSVSVRLHGRERPDVHLQSQLGLAF